MIKEKDKISVLISSVSLPSVKIGSWSNRITKFLGRNNYFDVVLSPTNAPNDVFKLCKKRGALPILGKFKLQSLKYWVGKDYLRQLHSLEKQTNVLDLVIMDDLNLVELAVQFKISSLSKVRITYSFHGHQLILPPSYGVHVDKVLFLTEKGYRESLLLNETFTPEVYVVGNGVNSSQFYPISQQQKNNIREKLGFGKKDEIVVWMANERPKKGLHLFLKIAQKLLEKNESVKFLILGNKNPLPIHSDRIKQFGQIPNDELPKYLQSADYYFFTTLWKEGFGLSMVEAAKCGCTIVASDTGGVAEVIHSFPQSYLVKSPNIVDEWLRTFEKARVGRSNYSPEKSKTELDNFHSYESWEKSYLTALEN